jgi:hypothetical protein
MELMSADEVNAYHLNAEDLLRNMQVQVLIDSFLISIV